MPSVHHVGVTVADLDRAVAFYRDVLGLEPLQRFSVGGEPFAAAVDVPGAAAEFVHLDGGGVRVELVAYDPSADPLDRPRPHRPGAAHVALSVDDVDAFHDALPDDVATLSEPRTTSSGTRILFLRDPEGNLVEVLDA